MAGEDLGEDGPEVGIGGQVTVVDGEHRSRCPGGGITVVDSTDHITPGDEHGGACTVIGSLRSVFDGCTTKLGHGDDQHILPLSLKVARQRLDSLGKAGEQIRMGSHDPSLAGVSIPAVDVDSQ